jgi:hypothetical protein
VSRNSHWSTSSTREVAAAPADVARLIRDASTWPEWQPEITKSSGSAELGPGDVVQGDAEMLGFKVAGRADIRSADTSAVDQDVIVGIRMRVTYEFSSTANGTAITHRLEAELPRGMSGRLLSLFLRSRLRRMQRKLLENLAEIK